MEFDASAASKKIRFNQDSTHALQLGWTYDGTAADAYAWIKTHSANNDVWIDGKEIKIGTDSGTDGNVTLGGNISGSSSSTGSFGHVTVDGVLKTGDIELENKRGHWRIVEESEYLSIYNVNTDKKYKILMEEIE